MGVGIGSGGGAGDVMGLGSRRIQERKDGNRINTETRRFAEKKQPQRDKPALHKERQRADGDLKVAATKA